MTGHKTYPSPAHRAGALRPRADVAWAVLADIELDGNCSPLTDTDGGAGAGSDQERPARDKRRNPFNRKRAVSPYTAVF